jgi:hypothetical protein
MGRDISTERKTTYYVGTGMMVLGGLLFASTFVTFIGNFGNFEGFVPRMRSVAICSFGGMALLFVGALVRNVGARGLAGSGILLDPHQARQELEPYSRMAGGIVKDALDEADIRLGTAPEKVIMIKCPTCGRLNEEDSKFCQECGGKL